MLPGFDGFRVLRTLRDGAAGPLAADTPVLLLTARGAEEDKVRGFRLGADDYVIKPFGASELLARVGAVEVNRSTRVVRRAGAAVALTPKEYDLLAALLDRGGRWPPGSSSCARCRGTGRRCPAEPSTSTWPSCGASWSRPRRRRAASSPCGRWGTASSCERAGTGAGCPVPRRP